MPDPRKGLAAEVPGLTCRRVSCDILEGVLRRHRPLDEQLDGAEAHPGLAQLSDRDRALVRRLVATALRRLGVLRALLARMLDRGLPDDAPRLEPALLIGAVQLLWLDVPDHAAVDLAVRLVQADRRAGRYAGPALLGELDAIALDTPDWLLRRWERQFGGETARAIAGAHAHEPPLDLTVKSDPDGWAARLRGIVVAGGTVRTRAHGRISLLPGYDEGAWWVQDAAAALPVRLFGNLEGRRVVDLCAAPGGKTAQLALAGAHVTAVDRSAPRLGRLRENLSRLKLSAETVVADAVEWSGGVFDAVLVDAPCMATGTVRRHPDIPWLKREADIAALVEFQRRLLDRATTLLAPGGTLIYCTCSLEPEENEVQVEALLAREPRLRRRPVMTGEAEGIPGSVSEAGDLRTLPSQLPNADPLMAGVDGFYAARLELRE
jgi:16S rRNA (cytosine967-C5)-methyltransferase